MNVINILLQSKKNEKGRTAYPRRHCTPAGPSLAKGQKQYIYSTCVKVINAPIVEHAAFLTKYFCMGDFGKVNRMVLNQDTAPKENLVTQCLEYFKVYSLK